MKPNDPHRVRSVTFGVGWEENGISHDHHRHAGHVTGWRYVMPEAVNAQPGERFDIPDSAGLAPRDDTLVQRVPKTRILSEIGRIPIVPRFGRFYPRGLLSGLPEIYRQERTPFRCVGVDDRGITADFNRPLGGKQVRLTAVVDEIRENVQENGGNCAHGIESALDGPGMEDRWRSMPTDFFSDGPFERPDDSDDAGFYSRPRLVNHLDDRAIGIIRELYGRLLAPGMRVLDLMSSWTSHLPDGLGLAGVIGLGMNAAELAANPGLTDYTVHDLNRMPRLPYTDREFDVVICTVSVEYLVHPFDIFSDVCRVLKPGGRFKLTFSNRWFPPKIIRIWMELHEFERIGLVLEYFIRTGGFDQLNVYSMRGLDRPMDDKYYPRLKTSDPVFAVWGTKPVIELRTSRWKGFRLDDPALIAHY